MLQSERIRLAIGDAYPGWTHLPTRFTFWDSPTKLSDDRVVFQCELREMANAPDFSRNALRHSAANTVGAVRTIGVGKSQALECFYRSTTPNRA